MTSTPANMDSAIVTPTVTLGKTPAVTLKKAKWNKRKGNSTYRSIVVTPSLMTTPKSSIKIESEKRSLRPYRPPFPHSTSPSMSHLSPTAPNISLVGQPSAHLPMDPPVLVETSSVISAQSYNLQLSGHHSVSRTVKNVKLQLSGKSHDYPGFLKEDEESLTDDDDIDSLGDPNDDFGPTILPYPGVDDYGNWLESQFPSVIPTGTSYFLKQLDMENEADVTHWANLDAPNYLDLLGPKQYDAIRKVLAEIKTIRRFIVSQDITSTKPWSYQEYLSHRSKFLPIDTCSFPSSKDLTDPKLLAMKNIKVPKSHIPPYTPKSPNVHSAPDPPTYESSYHSMTSKSGHSYHTTRPKMCMDGEYYDMHSP
jgi:hypothetical protein